MATSSPLSSSAAAHPALSRRGLLRSAFGLAAAAGLTACGAPGGETTTAATPSFRPSVPTSTKGEVTIWDRSGDLFKVFGRVIDKFNAVYPHIKVNHVAVDIDSKLPDALITGAGLPDGCFWDDAKIPSQHVHLLDLSPLMKRYRADTVQYKLDVNTVDGHIYGVPWDLDPGLLFYRHDLLDKAGVDPESITTYDKLLQAADTVRSKVSSARAPIHFEQDAFLSQLWLEMLAGQQQTSMADAHGKLRLDSKPYHQIFDWIATATKQKLTSVAKYLSPTDVKLLDSGVEVFVPWSIWWDSAPQQMLSKTAGRWRAMLLPAWQEGGARSAVMGGSSFLIPAKAKNPELAWAYYEFLVYNKTGYTTVYGPNDIYPGGLNTSVPSYRTALQPDQPLFKPFAQMGKQDLWSLAIDASKQIGRGTPLPSWWTAADKYLGGGTLQRVMAGTMSADDAISQASEQIQKNLVDRA